MAAHCAFLAIDLELQASRDKAADTRHYWLPRSFADRVDVAIISVSDELVAAPLQLLVQFVEYDVGQQRRQRTALRGSFVSGFDQPVLHHSRVKERANQPEHALIGNPSCQMCHQPIVVNPVEGPVDTLPTITSTAIPSRCGLSGPAIRWRVRLWRCWAGAIGKASCIYCWCCPMAVGH